MNLVSQLIAETNSGNYTPVIQPVSPITPLNVPNQNAFSLSSPDRLFSSKMPLGSLSLVSSIVFTDQVSQKQVNIVNSAKNEWQKGVRETEGKNRSRDIDKYSKEADFGVGGEWCGFFVGFAYEQNGFKHNPSFASYRKARDFFMYRQFTDKSESRNNELDQLRSLHQSQGSTRQYFMLPESVNHKYLRDHADDFSHVDTRMSTFTYNNLPVRSGDVALFSHGHVGLVSSYDSKSGILQTIEGNTSGTGPNGKTWHGAVVTKTYDLKDPEVRKKFDGFGRPAQGDFT